MKNYPLVSILMANWNGGKVYEDTLSSLSKITYPNWELVVVDNGSSDGTTKLPLNRKFGIKKFKLIENKTNLGFAPANNQGYEVSRGKYILLLNNDTLVEKDFLEIMVKKMEKDATIGVMQPKIKMMDNPELLDNAGSFFTNIGFLEHWGFMKNDGLEFNIEKDVFSVKGACMLTRKSLIEKLGLFDDDFISYFEESDYCWRVWLAGLRCVFYPATFIRHKVGFTIRRLDVGNLNWHYYKNRICSLIKNLGIARLFLILPVHLCISVAISIAFILKGQLSSSAIVWKAIWWNLVNIRKTLIKRKKVQNMRKVSDSLLFKKISRPIDLKMFIGDFARVSKDISLRKTR